MITQKQATRAKMLMKEIIKNDPAVAGIGITSEGKGLWKVKVNLKTNYAFEYIDEIEGVPVIHVFVAETELQ